MDLLLSPACVSALTSFFTGILVNLLWSCGKCLCVVFLSNNYDY